MSMENMDIRLMVDEHNIKYKDIAQRIGISATWLSIQMRYPLSPVMRERIIRAIESLREDIEDFDTRETQIRTVEAIPVDYIRNKANNATGAESTYLRKLLNDWERENGDD